MDHLALALDAPAHRQHARGHDDAAVLLEDLRPDHEVGDAGLVLQRDEQHALGRAGPLADQHDAGGLQPAAVAGAHGLGTGDDPPAPQVLAQEGDRMLPQRQAEMAVVRDDLAAGGHRPKRDGRLLGLGHDPRLAGRGGGEERQGLVAPAP